MQIRQSINVIKEVKGPTGDVYSVHENVKKEAVRFFEHLLTYTPAGYMGLSIESLKELLVYRCSDAEQTMLSGISRMRK